MPSPAQQPQHRPPHLRSCTLEQKVLYLCLESLQGQSIEVHIGHILWPVLLAWGSAIQARTQYQQCAPPLLHSPKVGDLDCRAAGVEVAVDKEVVGLDVKVHHLRGRNGRVGWCVPYRKLPSQHPGLAACRSQGLPAHQRSPATCPAAPTFWVWR